MKTLKYLFLGALTLGFSAPVAAQEESPVEAVKAIIGLTPRITLVGPGSLPRSEGKIKRVVDLRRKAQ